MDNNTLTINGKEYDPAALSYEALGLVKRIQAANTQINNNLLLNDVLKVGADVATHELIQMVEKTEEEDTTND